MTLADILIVYLAFGAPLAVYKYLQNRSIAKRRRVLISALTFFVWVPAAVEIFYLYLTNAYFGDAFVSRRKLVSDSLRLDQARDSLSAELIKLTRDSSLHDLRETVDRYAGLADAVRSSTGQRATRHELFDAAGSERYDLGSMCLMRRNLRRLKRHHTQARQDLVDLFEQQAGRFGSGTDVIGMGIELARQVEDAEGVMQLSSLKARMVEVWKPAELGQRRVIATIPPISMTASLNND